MIDVSHENVGWIMHHINLSKGKRTTRADLKGWQRLVQVRLCIVGDRLRLLCLPFHFLFLCFDCHLHLVSGFFIFLHLQSCFNSQHQQQQRIEV